MSDPTTSRPTTSHAHEVRAAMGYGLNALAFACSLASLTILAMMLGVYLYASDDFPGRYLFAAMPLLVAAIVLNIRAERLTRS